MCQKAVKTIILEAKMGKIKCRVFPPQRKLRCPVRCMGLNSLPQAGGWAVRGVKQDVLWVYGPGEREGRREGQKECIFPLEEQRKENLHSFINESEMHVNEIGHTLKCRPVCRSLADRSHSTYAVFSPLLSFPVERRSQDTVRAKLRGGLSLPKNDLSALSKHSGECLHRY